MARLKGTSMAATPLNTSFKGLVAQILVAILITQCLLDKEEAAIHQLHFSLLTLIKVFGNSYLTGKGGNGALLIANHFAIKFSMLVLGMILIFILI